MEAKSIGEALSICVSLMVFNDRNFLTLAFSKLSVIASAWYEAKPTDALSGFFQLHALLSIVVQPFSTLNLVWSFDNMLIKCLIWLILRRYCDFSIPMFDELFCSITVNVGVIPYLRLFINSLLLIISCYIIRTICPLLLRSSKGSKVHVLAIGKVSISECDLARTLRFLVGEC